MKYADEDRRRDFLFACYSQEDKTAVSKVINQVITSEKELSYRIYRSEHADNKKYQLTDSLIDVICRANIYLLFVSENSVYSDWLKVNIDVIEEENRKHNKIPKIFLIYLDDNKLLDSFKEFSCFVVNFHQTSNAHEVIEQLIK